MSVLTLLSSMGYGQTTANSSSVRIDQQLKDTFVSIDFQGASLEQAARFLHREAKRLDPDHEEINFIVFPEAITSAKPITLSLKEVSMVEALTQVCQIANVKFVMQDDAIYLLSSTQTTDDIIPSTANDDFIVRSNDESALVILSKLKATLIDKIDLDELNIATVLQFLAQKSKELDPNRAGVNFALGGIDPKDGVHRSVTLHLEKVPLEDVLRHVAELTHLKCSIAGGAVYLGL